MTRASPIDRAYDLAKSGRCKSVSAIIRCLPEQDRKSVETHLMLSGAIPVIIEGSALGKVVRHGYTCHTREDYLSTLLKAMQEVENFSLENRKQMGNFILKEFTWEAIANKWKRLFEGETLAEARSDNKTVFLSILARNKAPYLAA